MGYQSKTYSLSDEVIAAIEAARKDGLSPNKYLRQLIGIDPMKAIASDATRLARDRALAQGRGKATTETRDIRAKGEGKR